MSAKQRTVRSLWRFAILVTLVIAGVIGALGTVVYRITHPGPILESVNPGNFLLRSEDVSWPTSDKHGDVPGWWIAGTSGAPAIVLTTGYGQTRGDALSLAAALREQGFNVLVYASRGSGPPLTASTLGVEETGDMLAALDFVRARRDIARDRVGIWGVDVAARAALKLASTRPEVRALALDSPFATVAEFLEVQVEAVLGGRHPYVLRGCSLAFRAYLRVSDSALSDGIPVTSLADRPILFIQGQNRREMAPLGASVFGAIEPRKEYLPIGKSRSRLMTADDLRAYDRHVSQFFVLNLLREAARPN